MSNDTTNTNNSAIKGFTGEYDFLSMEYPCEFFMEGVKFKSASAAFYAQKNPDINSWNKFARLNPNNARQKASNLPTTDEYLNNREFYLYRANKAKFDNSVTLKTSLCNTGTKKLVNVVPYNDEWLGVYKGKGHNMLGRVLMKIRSEYLDNKEEKEN